MDPYDVLGVGHRSGPTEIRRAYLALARRHHPDAQAGAGPADRARSEARMREINDAWALLSDPDRKRRYDLTVDPPSTPPQGARTVPTPGWRPRQDDTAWMDDFEAWKHETDDVVPPDPKPPSVGRTTLTIFPVALFAVSIATGCFAMVLQSRPLLAMAFVGVALAALLFLLLPMLAMAQRPNRRRAR
jgi:hypothetical protein